MKYELIFKAVVGSQSYGLATPTSDEDIKGVYIQPNEDFLQEGKYVPYIEVNKDECYYELRNFLGLLAVGNPTAMELLASPIDCVLFTTTKFSLIVKYRSMFMTKKLYDSFGGYALAQIKKAKGLDKKFNWEKSRIEKKEVIDFCKVIGRVVGTTERLKENLEIMGINQSEVGLSKVEGFRDTYKLYLPPNPAVEGVIYRGVMQKNSNEIRVSKVPKEYADDWVGTVYFNKEAYSTHCRDYRSYQKWLNSRNETRYKESREGQQYDSKNIMHTVRLIMTIERIHDTHLLDIDMTEHRDFLLGIKFGKVNLEEVFTEFSERAANLSKLKETSLLPESLDINFVRDLELEIRNYE